MASSLFALALIVVVSGDVNSSISSCIGTAPGYSCYPGFCGSDAVKHDPGVACGPELAEINIPMAGGTQARIDAAQKWCDSNTNCHGFAIDPTFPVVLMFNSSNATAALQYNPEWTAFFSGPPQPSPPLPPSPPPPPPPPPVFPTGPCKSDMDCSLNGDCMTNRMENVRSDVSPSGCKCFAGWTGNNCQNLNLAPIPTTAGYGVSPNITSWGGSVIVSNDTNPPTFHLYVTEETDGKGLASWASHSQIIHAVSQSPLGPYRKVDVVRPPSYSNPQIVRDPFSGALLLWHIEGGGSVRLAVSADGNTSGPWVPQSVPFGCNNPTAAFHPKNGSLFVVCHNGPYQMFRADRNGSTPIWQSHFEGPFSIFESGNTHANVPGNCEDPFLFFDRNGHFHVIGHCYTCYWYPAHLRPSGSGSARGDCSANVTCSGHGFSVDGTPNSWKWVGGFENAPYGFTSPGPDANSVSSFSTRERPWGFLGGEYGDQILFLINGVSPQAPQVKYVSGIDWTYTLFQPVKP